MFCLHSCDLAQLTGEQMDIVMDWPKRTHTCTLLLTTSSFPLWAIVLQTSGVIGAAPMSDHLSLLLSDFVTLCFVSSAFSIQCHLFTISPYESWRAIFWGKSGWDRRELSSEWRGAAASPRLHILTQSEPRTHTKTHTPKLTLFYLYIFSDLCNKLLAFGSVHTWQRRLFCVMIDLCFSLDMNICLYFSVFISISACILGVCENTDGDNVYFPPQGWQLLAPLSNNGGWAGVWIWRDVPRADGQVSLQSFCPADAVHRWPTNSFKYAPLKFEQTLIIFMLPRHPLWFTGICYL